MAFIGNQPTAVPLTSSQLVDGIITTDKLAADAVTSAKILDSTIVNGDIASTTINLTQKVTGTLPVANGGTNLSSGFANGIVEADQWRITTNGTISTSGTLLDTNWERVDTDGGGYIGTGMSQSSGTWTFPRTGVYLISFNTSWRQTVTNGDYCQSHIFTTLNNSSYSTAATGIQISTVNAYPSVQTIFIFNVSDTTNRKVRLQMTAQVNTVTMLGESNENNTCVTFIRLGDSV
jgi:hypothetical protein